MSNVSTIDQPRPRNRNRIHPTLRATVVARSEGRCEARWDDGCTGVGENLHHITPRCRNGRNTPVNLLNTCEGCHTEIHRNEPVALERGYLREHRAHPARALARIIGAERVPELHQAA